MSSRRYKSKPMEVIPASHEPVVVDYTFEGNSSPDKLTFYCSQHFKRVNLRCNEIPIGYFCKVRSQWAFLPKIPDNFTESEIVRLTAIVIEHFDEGWITPYV